MIVTPQDISQTTPRFIQQSSPLRSKDLRDLALDSLAESHWIRMVKKENQTIIEVNPQAITAWN